MSVYLHWTDREAMCSHLHPGVLAALRTQQGWGAFDPADVRCWLTGEQHMAALAQACNHTVQEGEPKKPALAQDLCPSHEPPPDPVHRELWVLGRLVGREAKTRRLLAAWERIGAPDILTSGARLIGLKNEELAALLAQRFIKTVPILGPGSLFGASWRFLERAVHLDIGQGTCLARGVVRALRQLRYQYLHPAWSWERAYAAHKMWIWHAFHEASKGLYGVRIFGFRVARKDSRSARRRYWLAKNQDFAAARPHFHGELTIDDVTYAIGFTVEPLVTSP